MYLPYFGYPQKQKIMSGQPTLICIPDISGFTEFMSDTEFDLSSKVIPSLLNKVIYANDLNFKISEIEGDAVLFYRQGELPSPQELINQCNYFYTALYEQLRHLRTKYLTKPDAHKIPKILGLKIILHYGDEIGTVPVGKRVKLMGEDVIIAHRLMKNQIPINEYILLSNIQIDAYNTHETYKNFNWSELRKVIFM